MAQAWLNYSFANANLKLADQTLKAQLESYNLNKKRFDVGIDSEVPVRQAQISVETARNDVANYKTQIAQAQNLLNLLVGQAVPANLLPSQRVTRITSSSALTAGLPSDLLNNRPDLRAAEYKLSAAGANIGAAKARMFPTISLTGNAGYASTSLSDLFKSVVLSGRLAQVSTCQSSIGAHVRPTSRFQKQISKLPCLIMKNLFNPLSAK